MFESQCDNHRLMNIHLRIIDRYIGKEILLSWLMVLLILLAVAMSMETVHMLAWLADGRISAAALPPLLLNGVMNFSVMLIPLSLLLGILLAYSRLYKDSEMTAIMSAGMGPMDWYRPLLLVAIPVTTMLMLLTLFLSPLVSQQRDGIIAAEKNRPENSNLMAGRFNESKEGDVVFFFESRSNDQNTMHNVFQSHRIGGVEHIDIAPTSVQEEKDGRSYMLMQNGQHYIGKPGDSNYRVFEYSEYGIYVPDSGNAVVSSTTSSMTVAQLLATKGNKAKAELQWRIAVPIACFIVCLMALPLSYTTPRSGRYAKLALAILFYLVYSNLIGMSYTWLVHGVIPVWVGTWWVHIVGLIVVLLLFWRRGYLARREAS
jgi:lipopolysaccharide export system permease protein